MDMQPILSNNALAILKKRYLAKDANGNVVETPEQMFHRVAKHVANGDAALEDKFYALMASGDFLPNTPCLANAGKPGGTGMLSACFVLPIEDSMESIFKTLQNSAMVMKSGGGVGISFSSLRPEGDIVKATGGVASGPISFMKIFDTAIENVKQGGMRRGAAMAVLRCDHPDILKFIDAKRNLKILTNFNMSVGITDTFMTALEKAEDYDLVNPKSKKTVERVSAHVVWKKIIQNAWFSGEPGILFLDRINALDPLSNVYEIVSTNPCQPGWATVLTPEGIRTLDQVNVGSIVWSGKRWTKITNKVFTGVNSVIAYRTRAGVFYGTAKHKIVQNGEKIEVQDADTIDTAIGPEAQATTLDTAELRQHIIDGLVLGDGMYHKASNRVVLIVGDDDKSYLDDRSINSFFVEPRPGIQRKAWHVKTTYTTLPKTYDREIPNNVLTGTQEVMRAFLRGLYSANGSIVANRVTLKAASFKVIEDVQAMLSGLGILSYYTINRPNDVEFANGTYTCRQSYDLNIGTSAGRSAFQKLIGFIQPDKQARLAEACNIGPFKIRTAKETYEIIENETLGEEPVYDITVEADEHTYWTGGLLVSNCAEEPLPPYGSCNLGSINLARHVTDGKMNYDKLRGTIDTSVRFLDSVISVNKFPIQEIADQDACARRIGLGPMGFADALIKMGIRYDSEEACSLAHSLMKFINDTAIEVSEQLAKEQGPFPLWDKSRLAFDFKTPRRNAVVTTAAPTGTISLLAGCSSGIEPLFAIAMIRNQADMRMVDVNPLFVEIAKHEGWYSDELMEKIATKGTAKVDGVPKKWQNVFVTASEISPEMHVKMQAAFQANIGAGTSKTINMPKTATVEDVDAAYALAYKLGCKGITVYRDGCRENQVLSVGTKEEIKTPDTVIPVVETRTKDGKVVERRSTARRTHNDGRRRGETISKKTAFGTLHVTINIHPTDNEPFECFVELGKSGMETKAMTEALGRALSYLLSIPSAISPKDRLEAIADQFVAIGGGQAGFGKNKTHSIPDGIGKAIKDFINGEGVVEAEAVEATPEAAPAPKKNGKNGNGHHHQQFDICPECLCPTMTKGGKCDVCINPDCGYSKC